MPCKIEDFDRKMPKIDLVIAQNGKGSAKKYASDAATPTVVPTGIGVRHLQALLLFFCLTMAYALRVNLSVGIVAMVDRNSTHQPDFQEFAWNESTQSVILSSFFWGYIITQIPGGQLAQKYGPKIMLLVAMSICSVLNILTPLAATVGGANAVIALRVLQGLCQGVVFPSTHTLLSRWAPVSERGRLGTYCYAGSQCGTVIMLSVSGILASSFMGWPSIFYFSGAAGLVWCVFWLILGANSPADYKRISLEEKEFIETSLNTTDSENKPKIVTPWLAILTSVPMLALTIAHCSHNWGYWTLLTEMPTYLKNVLGLDIKQNALLSALPYFCMWMTSLVMSGIADFLINKKYVTLEVSRKLFNTIGVWGPMCALLALAYVPKGETQLAIGLLTLAVGINAGTYLGFQVNHIDLAPNHAGTMMGITNCAANIMSILAPLVVGFVLEDAKDPVQWRIVFFISAGIYFFGNLQFIIFGKAEKQPWNEPIPVEDDLEPPHRRHHD